MNSTLVLVALALIAALALYWIASLAIDGARNRDDQRSGDRSN